MVKVIPSRWFQPISYTSAFLCGIVAVYIDDGLGATFWSIFAGHTVIFIIIGYFYVDWKR